ncbi:MAG: agmatine deiminase family protein [Bdellovibrionales bacterium]
MQRMACLIISLLSPFVWADRVPRHFEVTPQQIQNMIQVNQQALPLAEPSVTPIRPFSDLEKAGYLFMSSDTEFDSAEAKKLFAKHLPADVTLVIFTSPGSNPDSIKRPYRGLIDDARLKVVEISNARSGFWARDGLPVPTWVDSQNLGLVDARYYHGFEPDQVVARWFQAPLNRIGYYFEGGNFMTNDVGDCITVDNQRSSNIPTRIFQEQYGCQKIVRLPYEKGIGHVDESVRFIASRAVMTDSRQYKTILEREGYQVTLLPRPNRTMETYINSLLVNGTMYVPVYSERQDQAAIQAYENAGFRAVPVESSVLSNDGQGSLHCITMTYPPVPFARLLESLGGREL